MRTGEGPGWLLDSPQERLAWRTKVLRYTLCLDVCVFASLAVPRPLPRFGLVLLCFCQVACQLSDLLDAVKRLLYHPSVIWLGSVLSLFLSLFHSVASIVSVVCQSR